MNVDHEGNYKLTNLNPLKRGKKVIVADHDPITLSLSMTIPNNQQKRSCFYKYKDQTGQSMFYRMTSDTQCLSKSFATNETFSVQVSKWQKQLKQYI